MIFILGFDLEGIVCWPFHLSKHNQTCQEQTIVISGRRRKFYNMLHEGARSSRYQADYLPNQKGNCPIIPGNTRLILAGESCHISPTS